VASKQPTTTSRSEKEPLEWHRYGECLHTALRKGCDSAWTSVAWNVVHLMNDSWEQFLRDIAKYEPKNAETLDHAASMWRAKALPRNEDGSDIRDHYARQIFAIALDNFDSDDWEGFASYLEYLDGD
jgi:hypothetical protein